MIRRYHKPPAPEPVKAPVPSDPGAHLPPPRLLNPEDRLRLAVERVTHERERALDGNWWKHAWYAYLDRHDVEALLEHAKETLAARA